MIVFHLITVGTPHFTFSNVSCLRVETAIFVFAETWGPWLSHAMMCGIVQFGAQYTTGSSPRRQLFLHGISFE